VIKSRGEPGPLVADVRPPIASVASDVPVYDVTSLSDLVAKSLGSRRFIMILLEIFSGVALLRRRSACTGSSRRPCTSARVKSASAAALGASAFDIVSLVIGGGRW